jgi:hypothetical protein
MAPPFFGEVLFLAQKPLPTLRFFAAFFQLSLEARLAGKGPAFSRLDSDTFHFAPHYASSLPL